MLPLRPMPPSLTRVFRGVLPILALLGAVLAIPDHRGVRIDTEGFAAAPQHLPNDPKVAPATAAAGEIELGTPEGTSVAISGWFVHLANPAIDNYAIHVNGQEVATGTSPAERIDIEAAYGQAGRAFAATITVPADQTSEICVFIGPESDLLGCDRAAPQDWLGVLITPKGVMVEIVAVRANGYRVVTPCGNKATVADGQRVRTTQILIDPGHGGSEVASVGPNGLGEKALNLDVAKRAAKALEGRGYSVQLTRTTDVRLPIPTRAALANALKPDLFLSLHHNGGATGRQNYPGTQVYYQHDDPEARRASGILYEELFAAASEFPTAWVGNSKDGVSTRLNARGTDFYGIHRRTPEVTSIITEFLWLSNAAEARLLARDDVKDAEAEAMAKGIDRWYRSSHKGSGYLPEFVDTFDSGGGGFENCVDPAL